jgi:sigma-B regulation protein RsbU (phosphoserine phosphatase)
MERFLKNAKPRTIRIVFTVLSLLVLGVASMNLIETLFFNVTTNDECIWYRTTDGKSGIVVHNIVPGGVADRGGVRDGDTLLQINGRPVKIETAQAILNSYSTGDTVTYLLSRQGTRVEARIVIVKLFDLFNFSLFLLGFGFLIVGYIVVMTKPDGVVQRMFATYGIFTLLVFGLFSPGGLGGRPLTFWQAVPLLGGFFIGRIFAPPYMVKFFLNFPLKHAIASRRWTTIISYAVSLVSLTLLILGNRLNIPPLLQIFLLGTPIGFFLTGLWFFIATYIRRIDAKARQQLRPILIGVSIGILVISYLSTLILLYSVTFFFIRPVLMLPIVLLIFTPAAFGYAIFRYRLMDINLIIERSLLYGAITASLAVVYLALVFGVGSLLGMIMPQFNSKVVNIAAFIVIAFIFDPVKRRVQDSIDRVFYRERHDYQKALLEFSQELPRFINVRQILESIVNRISATMHVDKLGVVIYHPDGSSTCVCQNIQETDCAYACSDDGLRAFLTLTRSPQSLAFINEESETGIHNDTDRKIILASGIVLAVPMLLQNMLVGIIVAGPKRSGSVYSKDDHDLLATVAVQAAIAIENARLQQSELEKHKIQEELDLARRIQQGLLPKSEPQMPPLDIAGISIPALSVGGDYYDYIPLGPKKLLTVVADVSGKGMSAALYMSKIQGMIQLAARMYTSPKEMLIHVNRLLYEGIERKSFITMILCLTDTEARTMQICRAGHNKAIIAAGDDIQLMNASGIGLGLERGPVFEETLEEITLPFTDDSLAILYSDGLSETMNTQHALLGEEPLFTIARAHRGKPAKQILSALLAAAENFRGSAEQHDDITVVVLQILK